LVIAEEVAVVNL